MGADDLRDRFLERVATLTGRSTYRTPVGGRATGLILTDQDFAAAMAMGRRRFPDKTVDDSDFGPELVLDVHQECRRNKPVVTYKLERAMMRALRMPTPHRRLTQAANAAYEGFVMGNVEPKPESMSERSWLDLCSIGIALCSGAYDDALPRMERALLRGV